MIFSPTGAAARGIEFVGGGAVGAVTDGVVVTVAVVVVAVALIDREQARRRHVRTQGYPHVLFHVPLINADVGTEVGL